MLTTHKALLISTLVAGTVAIGPAAYVTYDNQVRLHAFTTEGSVARASQRVADRIAQQVTVEAIDDAIDVPKPAIESMSVLPVRAMPVQTKRLGTISDAPVTVCSGWRHLEGNPDKPMVRSCDGPAEQDQNAPPPFATREKEQVQRYAPRPHDSYEFTFEIGGP